MLEKPKNIEYLINWPKQATRLVCFRTSITAQARLKAKVIETVIASHNNANLGLGQQTSFSGLGSLSRYAKPASLSGLLIGSRG